MELMPEFKLHRPETVAEAVALNGGSETARYLAGGTDMVVNIRRGIETPETLVDLNAVTEMTEIREDADGLHIGAAVKLQELGRHESVLRDYAAVAEAAGWGRRDWTGGTGQEGLGRKAVGAGKFRSPEFLVRAHTFSSF